MMVADVIITHIEFLTRNGALRSTFSPEEPYDLDQRVKCFH
jgi:hypothetical protein